VVFTSGATEANNLAIRGRIERCRAYGIPYEDLHVLYLPTMHASALNSVRELAKLGVRTEPISLSGFGIDSTAFKKQLRPETVLVCVDPVCGETGVRFDTLRLRRAMDAAAVSRTKSTGPGNGAALLVDASQLPLIEPIECTRLGADLLVLDAQKVGGIRGIGALIVPRSGHTAPITPIMQGGGQEEGLRPGTEPVALAAAFAAALELRVKDGVKFSSSAREARAELAERITSIIPQAVINESSRSSSQAPHILNISLPGFDTDYALTLLDTAGFAVSTKSACETDSEDGSRAVGAFTQDEERAKATLRISWGPETKAAELRRFAAQLAKTVVFLGAQ